VLQLRPRPASANVALEPPWKRLAEPSRALVDEGEPEPVTPRWTGGSAVVERPPPEQVAALEGAQMLEPSGNSTAWWPPELGSSDPPRSSPAVVERLDPSEIGRTLGLLFEPDQVLEVRVLDGIPSSGWSKPRTFSGYFRGCEAEKVVAELMALKAWAGVYITLNPINPALYARSASHLKEARATTADVDVTARRRLLFDFDAVRPKDISSTDAEHQAAMNRAQGARQYLRDELGWPEPLFASSGNGGHLVYGVDLPADDGIVEQALRALAGLFSDDAVAVDVTVGNAARICRLYGTLTCKGDSIPERPHRLARILEAPQMLEVVSRAQLEKLVTTVEECDADITERPAGHQRPRSTTGTRFDVDAFIERHGIAVGKVRPYADGRMWVLDGCPMDDTHERDRAAYIIQFASGAIKAACHHNRCQWRWRDLRARFEPPSVSTLSAPIIAGPTRNGDAGGIVPGARVLSRDRGNVGTVVTVEGSTAKVQFVSRDGATATVEKPVAELSPVPHGRDVYSSEPRKYEFLSLSDILKAGSPEYLVDGFLDRGELAVLYGAPASFKSFLALDLSLHVATGRHWNGCLTRPARVLYIAGEGLAGLRPRVMAWQEHRRDSVAQVGELDGETLDEAVTKRFFAIGSAVPLVDPVEPANLLEQIAAATDRLGGPPDLIVVDTLARCFLGGDENSSRDMGRFVDACDAMRKATGATILVVHHTRKDGEQERGSSALRAGADAMFRVTREEESTLAGTAKLEVEKRKDAAHAADLLFDMHVIDLGRRPDGRPLTSLVPVQCGKLLEMYERGSATERQERKRRPGTAHAQKVEILRSLATTFHRSGASASKLMDDTGIVRPSIYKRLNELDVEGHVIVEVSGKCHNYTLSDEGRAWLSRESPKSLSLRETETDGCLPSLPSLASLPETETERQTLVSPVSPQSPHPPVRGVGDEPETETETETSDRRRAAASRADAGKPDGGAA
jgi:hypothetical protein